MPLLQPARQRLRRRHAVPLTLICPSEQRQRRRPRALQPCQAAPAAAADESLMQPLSRRWPWVGGHSGRKLRPPVHAAAARSAVHTTRQRCRPVGAPAGAAAVASVWVCEAGSWRNM
eukprot:149373-Chlamydomonas_euryale.AAC.1